MAKDKPTKVNEADLAQRIAKMTSNAINVSHSNIADKQADSFRQYMRKPMAGDDKIKGRSKFVSNEVQSAVDWSTASVARVFDTQREPVSFQPNTGSPQDIALAKQMTETVNFILRQKNKHVGVLLPWLKNGFMTGLGVTMVQLNSYTEQGLPQLVKGLTDEALVQVYADKEAGKIEIVESGDQYDAPQAQPDPNAPPQFALLAQMLQPKVRDIKIRKNKKIIELNVANLPPEDFIVSKDAQFDQQTGGIKAALQGHRRVVSRAELIDLGHDEEKVMKIPSASDDTAELAHERSEVTDYEEGINDVNDDVVIYEVYTRMAIKDKKPRHYRITLGGDLANAPVLLSYEETSKFYPYAAFCPYPTPNTLFGQGIADRIGQQQAYISKMMRFVFDNLAQHANPIKVVNPEVTNVDDVLNLYPGAVVRSTSPDAGITYNQQQFTGGNALSVIQSVADKLDFATGVGPSMVSLNPGDMAETATAASQRANASQLFMELICRWFAETGYSYLVKKIIDELVNHPEEAQEFITRLTDGYTPIQIDDWDPDMDVSTNVSFGVMNKDFNSAILGQILGQQQAAIQMGITGPDKIRNTLVKFAENGGFTNGSEFYYTPEEMAANAEKAKQEAANAPPPQPSPDTLGLIQIEKTKAELKAQSDAAERDFEARKLLVTNDLERDRMDQDKYIKIAEIQAKHGAQVDIARINAAQSATRNDVDIAMAQMDQQSEAMAHLAQMKQQKAAQEQAAQMPPPEQMQPPQMPPQGV